MVVLGSVKLSILFPLKKKILGAAKREQFLRQLGYTETKKLLNITISIL